MLTRVYTFILQGKIMAQLSARKRTRKAFKTANKVLRSYLWLYLLKKILGERFYAKRIKRLHEKNALRVKQAITELKGLFTKVGQLLSVLSTILPDAYAQVLESLQDKAPASPFEYTKKTIQTALGESIESVFKSFDQEPIASASIGQVYKATLHSGEKVAVKVQHHDIQEIAEIDLNIVEKLVKRLSFFLKIQGAEHIYQQVRIMVEEELDYVREVKSMERIKEQLSDFDNIIVPKVYTAYSSDKMMVSDFHEGVKITAVDQLNAWGLDGQKLAEELITIFCKMILEDGFYHADPHPGNVLVNEQGQIILLDFGATATLNDEMRREIPTIIQHIIRKDTPKIIRSLQKMGFLGNDNYSKEVAGKMVDALTNFVQNEIKIDNLNLKDISIDDIRGSSLDKLRKELSIRELSTTLNIPKDWILLERAIILVQGISATIAPEYNPMDTVKPYLKKLVLSKGGLQKIIVDTIKQQFTALIQLPTQLNEFLEKANDGQLVVQSRSKDVQRLYVLGQQMMLVFGIITMIIISTFTNDDQRLYYTVPIGCTMGLILLYSIWKNRRIKS
jgi:predicted unusual protein kinase regulating ubiquinone biosynthesis (AarF/ABC1/UbiB family)